MRKQILAELQSATLHLTRAYALICRFDNGRFCGPIFDSTMIINSIYNTIEQTDHPSLDFYQAEH